MSPKSRFVILGAAAGVTGLCLTGLGLAIMRSRPNFFCPAIHHVERPAGMIMVDANGELGTRFDNLTQTFNELIEEVRALRMAIEARGQDAAFRPSGTRAHHVRRARRRAPVPHSSSEESDSGYVTAESEQDRSSLNEGPSQEEERANNLSKLLNAIDALHQGTEFNRRESLDILLAKREEFGQNPTFLWRLIRAHCDMHDISPSTEEKETHGENGKQVGEEALELDPSCAETHQWYAIMCGLTAQRDTMNNRLKNGWLYKLHIDKAIELKPQDPFSYYLMGRWCYTVSRLGWFEKKVATMLIGEPPSATVQDALTYFLRAEEIRPRYSHANYVFLAKCYNELGQTREAKRMCEAARSMDAVSRDDIGAQGDLEELRRSLGI